MKKIHYIIAAFVVLVGVFAIAWQPLLNAASTITWEGILPNIYTGEGGTEALNVAWTASTVGWDVTETSTATNALYEVESVTHKTSGTPEVGFGTKKTWTLQQDAAGANLEDAGYIGFEWADETEDTEDADFVIGNMAAGAAAATKYTFGSTGILTFVGGATADNVTAATELLITETNIQLSGAIDLEGGNVKINEDSGDYDFAVETDSTDNAFAIDSGNSTLETNGLTVTFNQGSADVDFTIESDGSANAFQVDAGNDRVGIFTAAPAVPFDVTGEVHFDGGDFNINEDSGDYDFKYETDSTDNAVLIDSGNSTLETNGLTVTFNQGGADVDFTIETDDNTAAFVVDAGNDTVKVDTGMYFKAVTGDPCAGAGFGEGAIFYNDTANILCFCDGTNDLKIVDGAACF